VRTARLCVAEARQGSAQHRRRDRRQLTPATPFRTSLQHQDGDLVMSVFGGMSEGERNRVKIRVKAAMGAQAKDEGRFLGGRPPHGYLIADAGPHPNPAKAADGKRLHKLGIDPQAMLVVVRIFSELGVGNGLYAIAEGLTRDGIPSPSAHDPGRNSHRSGIAWSKFAVRAILANPRYTGHQVWNKQRGSAPGRRRRRAGPHDQASLERNRQVGLVRQDRPPGDHRVGGLGAGAGTPARARERPRQAQAASLRALLRAAGLPVVRRVRPADARPLGPPERVLPVAVRRPLAGVATTTTIRLAGEALLGGLVSYSAEGCEVRTKVASDRAKSGITLRWLPDFRALGRKMPCVTALAAKPVLLTALDASRYASGASGPL